MICLPALSHRLTQVVRIMTCVSAVWLFASCDTMNRNATATHALEPSMRSPAPRFVPREALVKFKDGVSPERIASILRNNRVDVIAEIKRGRLYHVRILDDRSVESAITQLTSYQEIEYAEPNYRYETQK